MESKPKLYTHVNSGNSYKVRLLASLLNIPLDLVEVDFDQNEHQGEEFRALNPRSTIPVLVDGDITLTDSAAILIYLAGRFADRQTRETPSSFWSVDVVEQAIIVDWLAFAASWIQYGLATARSMVSFNAPFYGLGHGWNDQTLREAHVRSRQSLEMLQTHLKKNEWLALNRPTIAEAAVFPYVALANMADVKLDLYPAIVAWVERVRKLPGFVPMEGMDDA